MGADRMAWSTTEMECFRCGHEAMRRPHRTIASTTPLHELMDYVIALLDVHVQETAVKRHQRRMPLLVSGHRILVPLTPQGQRQVLR